MFGVSIAEIFLAMIAFVPGVLVVVMAARRGWAFAPTERPPIRWVPIIAAAIALILGAAAGLVFGITMFEPLLASLPLPHGSTLTFESSWDALLARIRLGLPCALVLALPGAGALGSLLITRDRSPRAAVTIALFLALGVAAGGALGVVLAPRAIASLLTFETGAVASGAVVEPTIMLGDLAAIIGSFVFGFGSVGALLTGTAAAASRSAAAFRNARVLSCACPGVALFLSALVTPPDVVSQLLLAFVLTSAWGIGLAAAAVLLALRPHR